MNRPVRRILKETGKVASVETAHGCQCFYGDGFSIVELNVTDGLLHVLKFRVDLRLLS